MEHNTNSEALHNDIKAQAHEPEPRYGVESVTDQTEEWDEDQ